MKKIMTLAIIALASVAMVSCCGQPKKAAECQDACCKPKTECATCPQAAECPQAAQAEVAPAEAAPAPAEAPVQ